MEVVEEKWADILENVHQEYEVSDVAFKAWLKPLTIFQIEGNTISILVPNGQMAIEYIQKKYTIQLKVAIAEMTGVEYELEFLTPEQARENRLRTANQAKKKETEEEIPPKARLALEEAGLNPRYTFDTFVVGKTNQFAHSACVAVAESPGEAYNPLFIYGGAGLGKTHLMHSIGHYVLAHDPGKKVLYVTSEQFTNEVIECIRSKTASSMSRLRDKYRKVDVLLIDDIQFIIGKDATQEEFFHTFNELHSAGKQIVLSSDRPPREMETLDERFRSRFEWGLIADIQPPDYETRMAILRSYAENSMRKVDGSILEYIAANIKSNIRELEGAYNKIIAYSRLNNVDINLENAREALKDIIYPDNNATATPEMILGTVCDHFGVRPGDITGRKRSSEFVVPRQVCMYILREYTGLTLDRIGKELGGKDHTTVMHGADKIKEDLRTNDELKSNVDSILKKLNLIN